MAKVLNKQDLAVRYAHIADETAKAINHHYWNEETGGYASNNQASNSFASYSTGSKQSCKRCEKA